MAAPHDLAAGIGNGAEVALGDFLQMPGKSLYGGNIARLQRIDDDGILRAHGGKAYKGAAVARIVGVHHPLQAHHALLNAGIEGIAHKMDADTEQDAAQQEKRRKDAENIFVR